MRGAVPQRRSAPPRDSRAEGRFRGRWVRRPRTSQRKRRRRGAGRPPRCPSRAARRRRARPREKRPGADRRAGSRSSTHLPRRARPPPRSPAGLRPAGSSPARARPTRTRVTARASGRPARLPSHGVVMASDGCGRGPPARKPCCSRQAATRRPGSSRLGAALATNTAPSPARTRHTSAFISPGSGSADSGPGSCHAASARMSSGSSTACEPRPRSRNTSRRCSRS